MVEFSCVKFFFHFYFFFFFFSFLELYIFPGPEEPDIDSIHRTLQPIVDELQDLYNPGIEIKFQTAVGVVTKIIQAVLILVSCDAPGLRKLLGFCWGASEDHFCTKCKCKLSEINQFRCDHCPRTPEEHRQYGKSWLNGKDAEDRKIQWQCYGYRYTPFNLLPYFDSIRFGIIDPMHSLLLGMAKHLIYTLFLFGILREKSYEFMQARMDRVKAPREIGQIPHRIASKMARFKSDQVINFYVYSFVL